MKRFIFILFCPLFIACTSSNEASKEAQDNNLKELTEFVINHDETVRLDSVQMEAIRKYTE